MNMGWSNRRWMMVSSSDHLLEFSLIRLCVVELPASYMVWACSPEAEFIKGKFVWVHWDVDELKKVLETTDDKQLLTLSINGMANWGLL